MSTKNDEVQKLSVEVRKGFANAESGKTIPKTSITNADGSKYLFAIRYEQWKDDSKTMREVRTKLEAIDVMSGVSSSSSSSSASTSSSKAVFEKWKNIQGKEIEAKLEGVEGGNAVFRLTTGKKVDYPLNKLDAASRKRAEERFGSEE
ncbi:hypothetical protein [Persicirhabdus sediminis]|uniref:Uncharacterized protein n=1 Tax=Persicirhabdus sediminis TaxID=454144 RepID=A0A8J7MEU4_9BACT|nr:hypothetical protein [Persicirhabdus sediminis]MBK1791422.1 hypothetical protein [Persicirhabdus sediminis]